MLDMFSLNKFRLVHLLIVLSISLILSSCTSKPVLEQTPMPTSSFVGLAHVRKVIDTWNGIHLLQSFDYNIADPTAVAKYYDFVWGAEVNNVAPIRAGNSNIFLTYYIPFHRDNGTFLNNNTLHNISYWKTNHPDWILYKCDRVTPAYEYTDPNVPLDFANPELVSWQVQTYVLPASKQGYDGIAADNVNLDDYYQACGAYVNGKWVQRYNGQVDDPKWRADLVTWLTNMQYAPHPLALIPNLSLGDVSPTDPLVQTVLSHVDGILDEDGFTNGGRGYLTGNAWVQHVQMIEEVQKQDKPYYLVNQFSTDTVDSAEVQWALASYLMGKEHSEYLFISTYQKYGDDTRYPQYNAQIGVPDGAMYQSQKIYWRNYSNGLSIVNPSNTNTFTVTLPVGKHYVDLNKGSVGQTITMPPHSGLVLLVA